MPDILLVIDMQKGFLNEYTQWLIKPVRQAISLFKKHEQEVIFTQFENQTDSPYQHWLHWQRFVSSPEIDIIPELAILANKIVVKSIYSAYSGELKETIKQSAIKRIFLCGIATESCILKTAMDCFEHNIQPLIITDACYSHAGEKAHQAGLLVLGRNIGAEQLISLTEVSDLLSK